MKAASMVKCALRQVKSSKSKLARRLLTGPLRRSGERWARGPRREGLPSEDAPAAVAERRAPLSAISASTDRPAALRSSLRDWPSSRFKAPSSSSRPSFAFRTARFQHPDRLVVDPRRRRKRSRRHPPSRHPSPRHPETYLQAAAGSQRHFSLVSVMPWAQSQSQ
jgi:hypothetical protein